MITEKQLYNAISRVNGRIYDDPIGSYTWNEVLTEELGLDK